MNMETMVGTNSVRRFIRNVSCEGQPLDISKPNQKKPISLTGQLQEVLCTNVGSWAVFFVFFFGPLCDLRIKKTITYKQHFQR